jgi:hypothetical protein
MMRIHAQARTLKAAPLTQRDLAEVVWES